MKALLKALPFILAVVVSCTSSNEWYLGEWTNEREDVSFTLTPTSIVYSPDYSVAVKYCIDKTGRVDIEFDSSYEYEGESYYGDPKTKTIISVQEGYEDDDTITEYHKKSGHTKKSTAVEPKKSKSNNTSKTSDSVKKWKASFDENGGYLVFESSNKYTRGRGGLNYPTNPTHLYIVLKGYGESCQKGMVNIFHDGWAGWIGLYEMFDDVVMLYDLREEGKRGGRDYSKPFTPITNQFFTWEKTTPITIKGSFEGTKETWTQISNEKAKYLSRDETFTRK